MRQPAPSAATRWPTAEEAAGSRLFSPLEVGRLRLRHRTWVPAMVPWRATEEGFVTEAVIDWYARFELGRDYGPFIFEKQADIVDGQVQQAIEAGATVVTGGERRGTVYPPTVLTGITQDMALMQDETFGSIWDSPQNSYTVAVRGSLPIWDWGERSKRIQANELSVDRALLEIEESVAQIDSRVRNEVRTASEFEDRAFAMQANLRLAKNATLTSLERYTAGETSALELVQSLRRELDTSDNFLETYLGWRSALRGLQELTFFDFETGAFILDRFGISFADAG